MLTAAYFKGEGVEKDMTEAIKWARKVGEQGDLKYQTLLATMYDNGDGVGQDKSEAANWYRRAANQGDAHSQKVLGLMCASGDGIEKSPVEALKWLTLCGDKSAQVAKLRRNVELGMSDDQIEEVKRAVQKYLRLQARRQPHE